MEKMRICVIPIAIYSGGRIYHYKIRVIINFQEPLEIAFFIAQIAFFIAQEKALKIFKKRHPSQYVNKIEIESTN